MPAFIETPLLSIVVPIRNMHGRLSQVRNWLAQAEKFNMEVIFVNDGSVDETFMEINEIVLENKYEFVKNFDGNFGGPGPARNFGMSKSEGEWVAFWDSDDEPNVPIFFEMIQLADLKSRDIAVGGWIAKQVSHDQEQSIQVEKSHSSKFVDILINPGIWRWAFKVELAKKSTFPDILMGEDLVFLANLKLSPRLQYNKEVYRYVKGNPGQLTSNERALQDRKNMVKYLNSEIFGNQFDLLKVMLRTKIRFSSFWHRVRNE